MLKVSSNSNPSKVAGAIANLFRDNNSAEIQVVGAGALNQAIKAITISRGFLTPIGKDVIVIPSFNDVYINEEEKTAIKLKIEIR